MSKPKLTPWLSGNPVHVGEYNASTCQDENAKRWWNGRWWSTYYFDNDPQERKNFKASIPSAEYSEIDYRGLAEKPHD